MATCSESAAQFAAVTQSGHPTPRQGEPTAPLPWRMGPGQFSGLVALAMPKLLQGAEELVRVFFLLGAEPDSAGCGAGLYSELDQ